MYGTPPLRLVAAVAVAILAVSSVSRLVPGYYLYLMNTLMMFFVLAAGLDLLLGRAGQFAFAHMAFFGIGCYTSALLRVHFDVSPLLGIPAAAALAALIGTVIAIPASRLHSIYLALATFAFAEGMHWVFNNWNSVTRGADGIRLPPAVILGTTIEDDAAAFPFLAVVTAIMLMSMVYLLRSRLGRSITALRESEHVAMASGINVPATKTKAFAISACYAGVAGGMFTVYQSYVSPENFDFNMLILVLSMIVVGGMGTLPGVIIGVLALGLLPEVLRTVLRSLQIWQEVVYGSILIACMVGMPLGLWGVMRGAVRRARR